MDAFFLKAVTAHPAAAPLVETLQDLRLALMRELGGHAVDFDVHCMPDTSAGTFVVTSAPIAALRPGPDGAGVVNSATGERDADHGLPASGFSTLDSSTGKGNGMLYTDEDRRLAVSEEAGGRRLLERLVDFNALPGGVGGAGDLRREADPSSEWEAIGVGGGVRGGWASPRAQPG